MVLANPEIANLPNWVIALVAAGGLTGGQAGALAAGAPWRVLPQAQMPPALAAAIPPTGNLRGQFH